MRDGVKKVSIYVSTSALEALEDALIAWNLCNKHKMLFKKSDTDLYKIQCNCKSCRRIDKAVRKKAIGVMSKLFLAYDKDKKRI